MKALAIIALITTASISAASAQDTKRPRFTSEQINQVLIGRGLPPLGSSRVLSGDNKREHTSIIVSTTTINSKSTITSK